MAKKLTCNHCGQPAKAVRVGVIYPHRPDLHAKLAHKWYWLCEPCDAYVGCHESSKRPLGTLATVDERTWRMRAHSAFDPLWKRGLMERGHAYAWLREALQSDRPIHIGDSDVATCHRIARLAREKMGELLFSEARDG